MRDVLTARVTYTLVVKHADGTYEPPVIGSIVDALFAPDDEAAVIERLAAETTRIVSLTVTEGGYETSNVVFRRPRRSRAALRRRRRLAGGLRAGHAVGARGCLHARPPALRGRRRPSPGRPRVARVCAESSDRIPKAAAARGSHNLEHDGEIAHSAAVVASWARYAEGTDERGEPIEVVDQLKDRVTANARNGSFIEDRDRFGDLAENRRFRAAYEEALNDLLEHGARRTLERYQSV